MLVWVLLERRCPGCDSPARFVCDRCWASLTPAPALALFLYDELARAIVLAAKNGGRRDLFRPLGRRLADAVPGNIGIDVVTWVPASGQQRRQRGYDQGRLLAKATAGRLGCPHQRLLHRVDRVPQTGRTRAERLQGPQLRARVSTGGNVLLVDDVRTTGASMRAGAAVLRQAGAESITTLAVAAVL